MAARLQLALLLPLLGPSLAQSISIKPADFDRFVMSCYLGGGGSSSSPNYYSSPLSQQVPAGAGSSQQTSLGFGGQNPSGAGSLATGSNGAGFGSSSPYGRLSGSGGANGQSMGAGQYQPPTSYFAPDSSRQNLQGRDGMANLGQQVPRANTIDNFIALVGKIEAANPRLANNPDQLIRTLLSRFRMDNYYYDVRSRSPVSEMDRRTSDIIPALLAQNGNSPQQSPYMLSDAFPEHLLDHDEKCSMYFMLSHFIDKSSPSSPPLAGLPVTQLAGAQQGQRPPSLQAAGAGYPAVSANQAFSGQANSAGAARYSGPSPSFGSPATSNMNGFGSGLSSQPDYTGKNTYGVNSPQPNSQLMFNQNLNNLRNAGQYSGTLTSNSRFSTPYLDGGARNRDERVAQEYGVVTVGGQDNAALVLNRVLLGLLAAATPPQTIRQLASLIYPTQSPAPTAKIDEELDPLFAVTLADLWAVSSIKKPGRDIDIKLLGDNGHWNDTMCPTSFRLDRAGMITFTTAELIGGLDGFNLGMFRRRLMQMRKNIRLSELLKMYYSKAGFRPQFAEVSVCLRGSGISSQLDDLHRQAEAYLRLYQLNLPIADNEISRSIGMLDAFKEVLRQTVNQFVPQDVCAESSYNEPYPTGAQDQCEIAKADVVAVLDSSPQASQPFMSMVAAKLAPRLDLAREGSSLTILTNQQDSTGYAGAYSFNAIVRNSTNTAEIGCALVHDRSQSYQGGQITDPTRLVEMFERALVNLDSEYLTRQTMSGLGTGGSSTSSGSIFSRQPVTAFMSSLFQSDGAGMYGGPAPKNTGGAKVIVWFNYGAQQRPSQVAPSPTNWNNPTSGLYTANSDSQFRFQEAKRYLRENFRGASVLAVAASREDVKAFVYDEERDIFLDIPQDSSGSPSSASDDYFRPSQSLYIDPALSAQLSGPADQLVAKLLQRMCDIPATFQYPMCFRTPSDNTMAVGYISPGRKQYWMMSPKTFFASRAVRMAFKVDGGRLRVCFGRHQRPDETAARNSQQQQQPYYQTSSISLGADGRQQTGAVQQAPGQPQQPVSWSSGDYYTGLEYGVCKDVAPGQEIDFVVSEPCYRKSIAECEPFYFVVREMSNPGEGDPNYMCRDEGCKRFDQVKFVMSHSGVTCSSALANLRANWLLLGLSLLFSLGLNPNIGRLAAKLRPGSSLTTLLSLVCLASALLGSAAAQQANVYDYGQGRYGEKRGNFTPSEVLAIILVIMTILGGLALTIGLCYYVTRRNNRGMTPVEQNDY